MRYRCTNCGNKCTVSVQKNNKPNYCIMDAERTAIWLKEGDAPVRDERTLYIRKCMNEDARGKPVYCIHPFDRSKDMIYMTIAEAAKATGANSGAISRAAKSDGKLKGGAYYWKYVPMTESQSKIMSAATISVEAYREALKKYNADRYVQVFGGGQ